MPYVTSITVFSKEKVRKIRTRIFSVLRESRESQGGDPLGSQSESWKFKKDDSEKQTVLVILLTLDLWLLST